MRLKTLRKNPAMLDRQVEMLYDLGLDESEIDYLVYLKTKKRMASKWL